MAKKKISKKDYPTNRRRSKPKHQPLWTLDDGITCSAFKLWQTCPEQFSVRYLDGYASREYSEPIEYGNLHHLCEEIYCLSTSQKKGRLSRSDALKQCQLATAKYIEARSAPLPKKKKDDLWKLRLLVLGMFEAYLDHYSDQKFEFLYRERAFKVPYRFNERDISLRGKIDGEYSVSTPKGLRAGLWETKTKSKIDRKHLEDQLRCDDQVLFYLLAMLKDHEKNPKKHRLPCEVTYNVLRRPGLRQTKKETYEEFVKRCVADARSRPAFYFLRIPIKVERSEIEAYERQLFHPLLRSFFAWWDGLKGTSREERMSSPYHFVNLPALVNAWGRSSYFEALTGITGNTSLLKLSTPFPELSDLETEANPFLPETTLTPTPTKVKLPTRKTN